MKIVGIEKLSLVDYPGMLSAVLFTPGCNFDCYFCHNRAILRDQAVSTWMGTEVALTWLDDRHGFLDAVVISGGEPTLQPGLEAFVRAVRDKGYLVKLDTNGSNPTVLAHLLREHLLDYVAMDVKAPPGRYQEICGVPVDLGAIEASIQLLMNEAPRYEFRTTVVPQLTEADVVTIAQWISGACRYVLQQFRRPQEEGTLSDLRNAASPHPSDWPQTILSRLEPLVASCQLRGFEAVSERPTKALAPLAG